MSDVILDNAETVIAAFGGIRPMAKKLGVAVTTVQGWKERGTIPIARLDEIKAAARKEGIDLMAAVGAGAPSAAEMSEPPAARPSGSVPPSGARRPPETPPPPAAPKAEAPEPPRPEPHRPDTHRPESPRPEAARAERVAPKPDAGVAAAEAADGEGTIIEEEIVEYEDRGWRVRTMLFGIGFGVAAVFGFVAAWYLGAFDQTASLSDKDRTVWEARFTSANDARARLEAQLTKVERQLAETEKALATANVSLAELRKGTQDPARQIDGLRAQVAELTKRIDALPRTAGDTGAIAKLDERMRAIEKQATELSAGGGQEAARLRETLSAAEKRLTALETRIGQLVPGGGYGALIIAIGQLRDTALDGRAFKAELDRVRALAKDYPEVVKLTAGLAEVAEDGVASRAALAERFARVSTEMLRAAAEDVEGDWADRAWGRLKSMVTIRRTGRDVTGTSPPALVTRAENALGDGRLGDALALVGQLPGTAREAGKAWIEAARKRLQAETALDTLQASVLKMVTGPGDAGAKP
jgi:hypothetical protein